MSMNRHIWGTLKKSPPDQVAILPISEKFNEYAEQVKAELRKFDVPLSLVPHTH